MARYFLPPNSKIRTGVTHKAPQNTGAGAGAREVRTFRIYRFDPDSGETPRLDSFELDTRTCGPMVLDALIQIKASIDSSVTFRRSCREGICGSCAMNINGVNRLACTTFLKDMGSDIRIYPLPAMGVVK